MWFFYVFSLLPIIIGGIIWWFDEEVSWKEWVGGSVVSLFMALFFQLISTLGMTSDVETWSGYVTATSHYGQWVEEYQQAHTETYACGTDNKGNTQYCTRTYYTTEHDTHYEHWTVNRDFGTYQDEEVIDETSYIQIKKSFGNQIHEIGTQSTSHVGGSYDGGDRNIYITYPRNGYVVPVTTIFLFKNKIKASPTTFSFAKVPTNISVYAWPDNPNFFISDRLMGSARMCVNSRDWDLMNTRLGPTKKVNVIMIGFGNKGPEYGQWQQAKFIGGKKNDLVLTFGGGSRTSPAQWAYVFGWTEKEIVKKNIETILLDHPINESIIPLIEKEINQHYEKKDWSKFEYITIDPPLWSYWTFLIVLVISQVGLYLWFHFNDIRDYTWKSRISWKRFKFRNWS